MFNHCRKKLTIATWSEAKGKQSSAAIQHALITRLSSSVGAHIFSFLPAKEAIKAKLTSKQFCDWEHNERDNHIWRSRIKNELGWHENFVMHLPNAKQVYQRLYHSKRHIPYHIEYFVLQAKSGYTKNLDITTQLSKEERIPYLWSALAVGDLKLARHLAETQDDLANDDAVYAACLGGHENIMRWIFSENTKYYLFFNVARLGDLHLMKVLIHEYQAGKLKFNIDEVSCLLDTAAASSGNLALVKWLINEAPKKFRFKPDIDTLAYAAKSGNLHLVRWLMFKTSIKTKWSCFNKSSIFFQYLFCRTPDFDWKTIREDHWEKPWRNVLLNGSLSGHFGLTLFVYKYMPSDIEPELERWFPLHAARNAAHSGNEDLTIWWLLKNKITFSHHLIPVLDQAVISHNLKLIKRLMEEWKILPNKETLDVAVAKGNIVLIEIILAAYHDKPLNFITLIYAAKSKNFAVIEWLTSPDRGKLQLNITDKMIEEAIDIYTSAQNSAHYYPFKESPFLAPKTLELLNRARKLVKAEPALEYKSPRP